MTYKEMKLFLTKVTNEIKGKSYELQQSIISLRLNELNANISLSYGLYRELNHKLQQEVLK